MKNEQDKISFDDKIINWISKHIVLVFLVFIIIVIVIPNLFARLSIYPFIKSDGNGLAPNEIGDAIGGMTAPIIGLFSAFLVYIAFRAQIKANEKLEEQNVNQNKQFERQLFESKFFDLIRIHRENVDAFILNDKSGKNVLIDLIKQFDAIYTEISDWIELNKNNLLFNSLSLDEKIRLKIKVSYEIFYYGYQSENSLINTVQFLLGNKKLNSFDTHIILYLKTLSVYKGNKEILGNYFRHMFNSFVFLHMQNNDIVNEDDKKMYAKFYRTQLSNHELILFFYNAISMLGYKWKRLQSEDLIGIDKFNLKENNLIEFYSIIKNIEPNILIDNINPKLFFDLNYDFENIINTESLKL